MWETMTDDIQRLGGQVLLNTKVTGLEQDLETGRITKVIAGDQSWEPAEVISSLELRATVGITSPNAPKDVRDAAQGLRYRDFITVALVLDGKDLFPDNWIYIHEPDVEVGRIQNFRSWSPWMVPDESKACIGMEYFVFSGDELWESKDDDLVALGARELEQLGLAKASQVDFGFAVRVPKAYPMYDRDYAERVARIREWLETIPNLQQVGRNGLHRYNNSDHSMLTAMRAVENITTGTNHDLWAVNAESVCTTRSTSKTSTRTSRRPPPSRWRSRSPGRRRPPRADAGHPQAPVRRRRVVRGGGARVRRVRGSTSRRSATSRGRGRARRPSPSSRSSPSRPGPRPAIC